MNIHNINKYKNKKIEYDNIKFDSVKEKNRYVELKILEKNGHIKDLQLQVPFLLQPTFKKGNTTYRAIKYIADFVYEDKDGNKIVEDVKGMQTPVYKLKKKMFEYNYKNLKLREI